MIVSLLLRWKIAWYLWHIIFLLLPIFLWKQCRSFAKIF